MRKQLLLIALAAGMPALLNAGLIVLPVSTPTGDVIFNDGTLAGTSVSFGGTTTTPAPLQWDVTITGGPVTYSSPYSSNPNNVSANGATITFSLTDTPGTDSITGTVVLNTVQTDTIVSSNDADLIGVVTITNVTLASPTDPFEVAVKNGLGETPANGETAAIEAVFRCLEVTSGTTSCLSPHDPIGGVIGATLTTSTVPEPAAWGLLGAGLGVLALRRRKTV